LRLALQHGGMKRVQNSDQAPVLIVQGSHPHRVFAAPGQ
jgi:hypothetical protein